MFEHILDYYAHQMRFCPWADTARYAALSKAYFNTSLGMNRETAHNGYEKGWEKRRAKPNRQGFAESKVRAARRSI